jgi:hypothetical protein
MVVSWQHFTDLIGRFIIFVTAFPDSVGMGRNLGARRGMKASPITRREVGNAISDIG